MREQDPVFYDALFRQKRKGGKWRVMPSPVLEGPVADTHAHLQMLADPACELARAGAHGVASWRPSSIRPRTASPPSTTCLSGSWRPRAI